MRNGEQQPDEVKIIPSFYLIFIISSKNLFWIISVKNGKKINYKCWNIAIETKTIIKLNYEFKIFENNFKETNLRTLKQLFRKK